MQKVLRGCVLGLLLVTGMSVSASKDVATNPSRGLSGFTWLALGFAAWSAQEGLPRLSTGIKKYGPLAYNNILKPVGQFIGNNWAKPTTPGIAAFSIYNIIHEFSKSEKEQSSAKIILHGTLTFGSVGLMLTDWDFLGKFNRFKNYVSKKLS